MKPFFSVRSRSGHEAIVDEEDHPFLSRFRWHHTHGYFATTIIINKKRRSVKLHQMVMGFPSQIIDHKNRNPLDNRKQNLRLCTHAQNCVNSTRKPGPFYYRGVTLDVKRNIKRYQAKISLNKKRYYLGYHATPEDAARAYDLAAIKLHGEFAVLNFPGGKGE